MRRLRQPAAEPRRPLLTSLHQTCRDLTAARCAFQSARDPDLVESYAYEISALQCRHTYLLGQLRALDPTGELPPELDP